MLLEPEPHIPDIPDVSSIPEDVDPGANNICDDVPVVAAVAGATVPTAIPPPSKLAVDPYIPDGEIPPVEHVVPLVVIAPLVGIAIVPVTLPVGAGLRPGDVSSVAPSGIPVAPTDPPGLIPRGEVTPTVGIAVSRSPTSTWANAGLHNNGKPTAATQKRFIESLSDLSRSEGLRRKHALRHQGLRAGPEAACLD